MNNRLWVDIETYSSVDLPKTGVYRYAASPDFLILMACWSDDGRTIHTAITPEEIAAIPGLTDPSVTKVAHNAQFERICFSHHLGLDEYLPPEQWHDTQAVAGEYGYPQKLEYLGPALGGEHKDEAGTRLINIFSKPNRKGVRTLPEEKPEEWLDFIAYCEQDVVTLIDVDRRLGDHITPTERDVFIADQHINDTGIAIDVPLAQQAKAAAEANAVTAKARFTQITGVENPNSQPQVMDWVREQGLPMKNLRAETVAAMLLTDLTDTQREALELRQELALAASKKYGAALKSHVNGRLHGTLKFFGAHTGRWAGRGTQVQNLPRLHFTNEVDQFLTIEDLMDGRGATPPDLKRTVRPMFWVNGCVVDYSSIEARVIAWLAGEDWALQAFRAKRDIYVETAQRMGGLTRAQGKIAVLALGFAGSAGSLRAMAGDDDYIELSSGRHRIKDLPDDKIRELLVYPWRTANRKIVRLWGNLENAFADGGKVGQHLELIESEDAMGRSIEMRLPSGRSIFYHGTKWERYRVEDPVTGRYKIKEGWRYADPKYPRTRISTYGGRLAENATQAVARDILAEALVRLRRHGYTPVAHVHDEIIVERTDDVETVSKIMCELPGWATGLPMDAEGFVTDRYRKG